MWVLDTSAVSAVMHRQPLALERLERRDPWSVILCSPVAAEIHFGLANLEPGSRRAQLLQREYRLIRKVARWIDWDEDGAEKFGELKSELRRRGTPIDDFDIAIASIALTLGATVATRNARHFERIEGLQVEDWDK